MHVLAFDRFSGVYAKGPVLTTILTLEGGHLENAIAEKLELVLSIWQESADDIAIGSGHRVIGILACSQSRGSRNGGSKSKMAEKGHKEGMEHNGELHV